MTKPIVEQHTIIVADYCEYRIRPNPDVPEGYAGGAVLEYRDVRGDGKTWHGYFGIEPSAIEAFADALKAAAPGNGQS